jgi:hypothetical protein
MGRTLMYTTIAALAVFVASTYSIVEHGGGSIGAVRRLSIHDLTAAAPAYDGSDVSTTGILDYAEEHGRYEIVDEGNFSVIIREYADEASLERLLGLHVTVTGEFGWDDEYGTFIDAASVHPFGRGAAETE